MIRYKQKIYKARERDKYMKLNQEMNFSAEMENAKKRVEGMDKADGGKDRELFTIICSLEAGIKNPKSKSQFDAFFMLIDLLSNQNKKWNFYVNRFIK